MPIIPITRDMLMTILGALHDTQCDLEAKCCANPEEADQSIADYTEEIVKITQAQVWLRCFVNKS
jgi:hypothetical protein